MKRLLIFFILVVIICGCATRSDKKEDLFFIINENIPFERFICFPYEINTEFLKKKKIKSYVLFDSRKSEKDFIFSFYNSIDSPVTYVQTGWIEKFYYGNQLDSIIYYNKNDSGETSFFSSELYIYNNKKIDSIKGQRPGVYTTFTYRKDTTIRKHHTIIPPTISIDSFFYKKGRIEKVMNWNSKNVDELGGKHGFAYTFKKNQLITVSSLYDNLVYNLTYNEMGNLTSIYTSNGGRIDFKYGNDGIMTELLLTHGDLKWSYIAKIEYQ